MRTICCGAGPSRDAGQPPGFDLVACTNCCPGHSLLPLPDISIFRLFPLESNMTAFIIHNDNDIQQMAQFTVRLTIAEVVIKVE